MLVAKKGNILCRRYIIGIVVAHSLLTPVSEVPGGFRISRILQSTLILEVFGKFICEIKRLREDLCKDHKMKGYEVCCSLCCEILKINPN